MTKRDKLIEQIRRRPPTARFSDVAALLDDFGWTRDRTSGSHVSFTKPGEFPILVVIHDKCVKRVYLDRVCERLGLDDLDKD